MVALPHVLICDDDAQLCEVLSLFLTDGGFVVKSTHTGLGALRAINSAETPPQVVVLDEMLPDINGTDLLPHISKACSSAVLMLSACGDANQRIAGFESGADDYLVKPCVPAELLLRLRALVRRSHACIHADTLKIGPLHIDVSRQTASVHQMPLRLTQVEFGALTELARASGKLVNKHRLSAVVLGRPLAPFDRAVDVHVSRLRHLLKSVTHDLDIESVRGKGYALRQTTGHREDKV
jgi:two-component system, OmpR family, response regulator